MIEELYSENSANHPRIKTDTLFADYTNEYSYNGFIDKTIRYIEEFQLLDEELWHRFVQQFREKADNDAGWRGEYWGKMMRGAALTYAYTKNDKLYEAMALTVKEMIDSADNCGRISTYDVNCEFDGWDIWSRKYVLLGMQYFIEICTDKEFIHEIIDCMRNQLDYIISKIGRAEDGKKPINLATRHWRGLNSSSLLEPVVRLYSLTKEKRYLDFAEYIVDEGGTDVANIFELAYENKLKPYQYPITKAYEMISCFEGLLEYYRITGKERHRISIINFADRILENDFTVIGSCGCTHELFDNSVVRQANTTNTLKAQETCVTVTLMKFFYQLTLLTGESKYADAFEISMYNAYLGAVNTEKVIEPTVRKEHPELHLEPLPFDSYSPLTAGTRGVGVGGFMPMSDKHYYGCCACIGAAGSGLIPKMALLVSKTGFTMNLYISGRIKATTLNGNKIIFDTQTAYPKEGGVKILINLQADEKFVFCVRNPAWSKETNILVNGNAVDVKEGYVFIDRVWKNGDEVEIFFDMRTEAIYPIAYGTQILMNEVIWGHNYVIPTFDEEDPIAKNHIALRRGPIMLAQENRLGYNVNTPISVDVNSAGFVDVIIPEKDIAPYEHIVELLVPLKNGTRMTVTDYASAGKLWTEESKMAVWMLTDGVKI